MDGPLENGNSLLGTRWGREAYVMVVLRLYNGISVHCETYCTVLEEGNKNIFDEK